jgi:hemerythrin-like domain-containing protein
MVTEQLEADHNELDKLLKDVFTAISGADCAEVFQKLDLFWARLAMHIRAEHLHLFPALTSWAEQSDQKAVDAADLRELLKELRADHDFFMVALARAIKAMRLTFHFGNCTETLTFVCGLVEGVRDRLETHNQKEESQIYSLASSNLQCDLAASLRRGIALELSKYPHRFQADRNIDRSDLPS